MSLIGTNVSDNIFTEMLSCFCYCLSVPGYLGCFNNNEEEDVLPDKRWIDDHMTIAKCLQFCRNTTDLGMRFAGVHSRTHCLCRANNSEYDQHGRVEDWKCDEQCAGNNDEICGGYGKISIYDCESTIDVKIYIQIGRPLPPSLASFVCVFSLLFYFDSFVCLACFCLYFFVHFLFLLLLILMF